MRSAIRLGIPMFILLLVGCTNTGLDYKSGIILPNNVDAARLVQSQINDSTNAAQECENTWQWNSYYGNFQLKECERGNRYLVHLTDQVLNSSIDLNSISWAWHNCRNRDVISQGTSQDFFVAPPHISTCSYGGYYLLLVFFDDSGQRFSDSVWFVPGRYLK